MYLLFVYLYLSAFIILISFARVIGYKGASILVCLVGLFCTMLAYTIFFEVGFHHSACSVQLWSWICFDLIRISWCFLFDSLSVSMLIIITTVSLCATAYSVEYMSDDPHINRFLAYLVLFTFFMVILVTANNLIQLFVGWEGVGVCSYLLINFWFTRTASNKSALFAVFVNKIGDIALLVSFGFIFAVYKTWDITILFGLTSSFYSEFYSLLNYICYLFLIGAVAKSAQVGLHVWLPEAMEGPTPVSSLIHAATMVTAGIFLLVRFSFILETSSCALIFCMILGAFTVFFGSSAGMFLFDVKRIVAYSTCSQLGYMFMSCGFSNYSYAMFHLIGHAFFKALLFLTAGYIIHFCDGEQDLRKLGGIIKLLPSAYIFLLIGSLSLVGFPFMSGFITKEVLIEATSSYKTIFSYDLSIVCQFLSVFSLLFSIFYSARLLFGVFLGTYNGFRYRIYRVHYAGNFVLIPLLILSFFSIAFGYVARDFMVGDGSFFWMNSIFYPSVSLEKFDIIDSLAYCAGCMDNSAFLHFQRNFYDFSDVAAFFQTILLSARVGSDSFDVHTYEFEFCDYVRSGCSSVNFGGCFNLGYNNALAFEDWFRARDFGVSGLPTYWPVSVRRVGVTSEFNRHTRSALLVVAFYFFFYISVICLFMTRILFIYRVKVRMVYAAVYLVFAKKYSMFRKTILALSSNLLYFSRVVFSLRVERGVIEVLTGYSVVRIVKQLVYRHTKFKTGVVYHYAGFFLLVITICILFLV